MARMQQVVIGGQSEAAVRQEALIEHQGSVVRELVELEGRQTTLTTSLARATNAAERSQIANALREVDRSIAGLQADLAKTRSQLGGTTIEIPVMPPAPPGFAEIADFPGQHNERMFGLTTTEFIGGGGFLLLLPLALAAARAIWRRGSGPTKPADSESATRLARLEQAVESVAIEVERIGESQRFNTRLLTERPQEVGARVEETARPAGDARR